MSKPLTLAPLKWISWRSEVLKTTFRKSVVELVVSRGWQNGREQFKLKFWMAHFIIRWPCQIKLRLDITKYGTGGYLHKHTDKSPREEVRQFNAIFVLKKAQRGGELLSEKFVYNGNRLKVIEVSRYEHEVTTVEEGERVVAIIGFAFSSKYLTPPPF